MNKVLKISIEPSEGDKSIYWRANGKLHYIPKSQITWNGSILTIPKWLYEQKQELFNYLALKGKLKTIS